MSYLKDHELKTTDLSLSDLTICSRDCFILEEIRVARSLYAVKAFSPCSIPCLRRFLTSFCYEILSWFVFSLFMAGQNEAVNNTLQFVCLSFAVLHTELLTDLCLKIS